MKKQKRALPQWWYVFLSDLRIRLSRFRFLRGFRYILLFTPLIFFILQFFFIVFYAVGSSSPFADGLGNFLEDWAFRIETIITAFVIFLSFNSSLSYFVNYTEPSELEIIAGAPISTRSFLFGKFLGIQLNNLILIPLLMIGHIEIARIAGTSINWWYFFLYILTISILFFSLCWLGLILGPMVVFRAGKATDLNRRDTQPVSWIVSAIIILQLIIPFILSFLLEKELFRRVFAFLPHGWFAAVGSEMFGGKIELMPSLFGLFALLFGLIFVALSYYRTKFTLNLEDFESLSSSSTGRASIPKTLALLEKLPLPYKYAVKSFWTINHRKGNINRLMDILLLLVVVAVIVGGFVFKNLQWGTYIFYGSIVCGFIINVSSSTEGLQLLFGIKNTFLICQSAPKGIRKLLVGKMIQLMLSDVKEFLGIALLLLIFYPQKLLALLIIFAIICGAFNGLATGLLALSIAPFFEMADITSNPIRGLQLSLIMNTNLMAISGLIAVGVAFLWATMTWLVVLLLVTYFILTSIGFFLLAEKLFQRFEG